MGGPARRPTAWVLRNAEPLPGVEPREGSLKGKTLFITGATRGIGLAIGVRAARDGANVVICAKTTEPHPKLPGTIYTAAEDIEAAGGRALAIKCDIRFEEQVAAAVQQAVDKFGGIDILVNNASAISPTTTDNTTMKRFDLMNQVNARGTFMCSKHALPHLRKSAAAGRNPHILTISPPLNMEERWFQDHVAYSMAKYGMSMCSLGLAGELREDGVGVNCLWPRTVVATAAVQNLLGGDDTMRLSRKPEVMSDAAYAILASPAAGCTGNFFIDDEVLATVGKTDLREYALVPGTEDRDLGADFFC